MRIWSLHPQYLDSKGLVALWRETLLAKKVLEGKTKGYKNHPQLIRFKKLKNPLDAISEYLEGIVDEADKRGYVFNRSKINSFKSASKISVTTGQISYELKHLLSKLKLRDPKLFKKIKSVKKIKLHPLFLRKKGKVEKWEKTK